MNSREIALVAEILGDGDNGWYYVQETDNNTMLVSNRHVVVRIWLSDINQLTDRLRLPLATVDLRSGGVARAYDDFWRHGIKLEEMWKDKTIFPAVRTMLVVLTQNRRIPEAEVFFVEQIGGYLYVDRKVVGLFGSGVEYGAVVVNDVVALVIVKNGEIVAMAEGLSCAGKEVKKFLAELGKCKKV